MLDSGEEVQPKAGVVAADRAKQLLRQQGIISVVVIIAALKAATPVILPLVVALFLVALFFPLQRRLYTFMRHGLATALTLLILLVSVGILGAILWVSLLSIAERLPSYQQELNRAALFIESYGVAVPGFGSDAAEASSDGLIRIEPKMLLEVALPIVSAGGLMTLVFSYLVLSLLGFEDYARRIHEILPSNRNGQWLEIARQVSRDFQRYMIVRTLNGLISGVAVGVATWFTGVEFSFIWGLLTFLLSYIPIFGTIAAALLTIGFALAQFGQWQNTLLTATSLIAIHAVLGNFVSPMLYGKFLKPTPLTILLSVGFWGWLWGIPGAFIGVPLTILLVIICQQFHQTRWISKLLANMEAS